MQRQNAIKSNKLTTTVAKFQDCPRCIKELDDVIVVGSLANTTRNPVATNSRVTQVLSNSNTDRYEKTMKGLFGVCVRDTGYTEDVNVGSLINNSVNIFKQSNSLYQSFVCNNDHKLYLMDIVNRSGVELNSVHKMDFALNHSAVSPDNKTLVVVGDNSKFYLVHPEEDFDKNKEFIQTNLDSGFSIDFNTSGLLFSVCFQAGVNQIYDIRNTSKPIHEIYSTRKNNQSGAFRVCKFTKNTDDLLFISEHQSRVHMVDARDFMTHQVVVLPKIVHDYRTGTYNQPIVKQYDELMNMTEMYDQEIESMYYTRHPSTFSSRVDSFRGSRFYANPQVARQARAQAGGYPDLDELERVAFPSNAELEGPDFYLSSEIDIIGLEVLNCDYYSRNSSLIIGCDDNGLVKWDIDSWKRRCFPTYEWA
ncbi:unnamed protein product [Ambrosiozyma monospora]|uniref:Unnamed protein product n=1 Tax=Ambrosiozyma monospora TaxID=43982 RepID=A0ACB5SWL8_AMBMO|nr:unnamed protein product [Ambrosiozyma monospora]